MTKKSEGIIEKDGAYTRLYSATGIEDIPGVKEYIQASEAERLFGVHTVVDRLSNWVMYKVGESSSNIFIEPLESSEAERTCYLMYLDVFKWYREGPGNYPIANNRYDALYLSKPQTGVVKRYFFYLDNWWQPNIEHLIPQLGINCVDLYLPLKDWVKTKEELYSVRDRLREFIRFHSTNFRILITQEYSLKSPEFIEILIHFLGVIQELNLDADNLKWSFYSGGDGASPDLGDRLIRLLTEPCIALEANDRAVGVTVENRLVYPLDFFTIPDTFRIGGLRMITSTMQGEKMRSGLPEFIAERLQE